MFEYRGLLVLIISYVIVFHFLEANNTLDGWICCVIVPSPGKPHSSTKAIYTMLHYNQNKCIDKQEIYII